MAPRRRCPVCGSKQWHKEPSSGLITCSEGHVLQNYRNETREVTELGPHTLKKRTLKSGRKRKQKQSKADPNLYHGERARYHYFQCLQLVLRMQVAALIKLWELPSEFEVVCRDVWALHLSLLPNPPPAEPLHHMQDDIGSKKMGPSQEQAATSRNDTSDSEADNNGDDTPVSGSSSSSSSSSSEDEADDPVMAELMRENSETSSSYDEDDNDLGEPSVKKEVKRKKIYRQYDAPASNVAVLMVACWTLRLPIIYMDFIRLIEAYELPYLDPIRLLPASLTAHLTKHTAQALSPHHAPTPLHLHRLASRLAKLMYASYAVYTPEMNAAPVLWRAVCGLYGTPTLYILTKKVARVISIPLMLHNSVASPLPRAKQRDPVGHKYDNAVPEVSLLATVIVVLKMVYGLDGRARLPKERDDPACALPRLSDYLTCLKELDEKSAKDEAPFSTTSHSSILDLSEHELDKYLDFCEGALLPREDQQTEQNAATELFPLPSKEVSSKMARIGGKVTELGRSTSLNERSTMSAMSVDSDGKALSPGESYAIFNTLDTLGALPDDYEVIIRRAAHWAGVSEEYVCGVAERYERRLVRWWDGVRKKEREENVE